MIEEASQRDIDDISEIYNDAILHTDTNVEAGAKSREEMEAWFHAHQSPYFILVDRETDGSVSGFISLSPYKKGKAEVSVYVKNGSRGKGCGKRMLASALEKAKEQKALAALVAFVLEKNIPSRRLFESAGFRMSGMVENTDNKFGKPVNVAMYRYFL